MFDKPALLPLGCALAALACTTSANTVLYAPLRQDCEKAQLENCKEMTEGVVAYVDGQTVQGSRRLLSAGSENSREGLVRYAELLERAQGLPQTSKYKKELAEVVLVLSHVDSAEDDAAAKQPDHMITAETDLYQARDGTVPPPGSTPDWCSSNFGSDSKCVMVTRGPLFVTDVISVGRLCRGQFASVVRGGSVRNHIEGPFDLHGGRLLLTSADTLVFGQKPAPKAPEPEPVVAPPTAKAKGGTTAGNPASPPPPEPSSENSLVNDMPKDDCAFYWSGYVPYREVE
jgi:hypothetical protein